MQPRDHLQPAGRAGVMSSVAPLRRLPPAAPRREPRSPARSPARWLVTVFTKPVSSGSRTTNWLVLGVVLQHPPSPSLSQGSNCSPTSMVMRALAWSSSSHRTRIGSVVPCCPAVHQVGHLVRGRRAGEQPQLASAATARTAGHERRGGEFVIRRPRRNRRSRSECAARGRPRKRSATARSRRSGPRFFGLTTAAAPAT